MLDESIISTPDHVVNGRIPAETPKARVFTVHTRPRRATNAESMPHTGATPLEALDAAVRYGGYADDDQPVAYWGKDDPLSVCDIDFHGTEKFDPRNLCQAWDLEPSPLRLWLSHRGGVKAVFGAIGNLTADEAAALYGWAFMQRFGSGCTDLEVMHRTALPGYRRGGLSCGEVIGRNFGTDGSDALRRLIGSALSDDANNEAREEWLEEEGRELGMAYPHEQCPIEPGPNSRGGKPVMLYEDAVHCFRCAAKGVVHPGCRSAGRVPYYVLTGGVERKRSVVGSATWNWLPWTQVRHYLQHEGVPDKIAPDVYRAALKAVHFRADDEEPTRALQQHKLDMVFWRNGSSPDLVLVEGGVWVNASEMGTPVGRGLDKRIKGLPQLRWLKPGKGNKLVEAANGEGPEAGRLIDGQAIGGLGWVPVTPLHGVDMWEGRDHDDDRIRVVIPGDPPFQRRRLEHETLNDAQVFIESFFPGVNFDYLRLCIYAKAFAQLFPTEPPIIYAIGQSGSGKTHTWLLAAEIALCKAMEIKLNERDERFAQNVANAAHGSDMAFIDELTKCGPALRERIIGIVLGLRKGMPYHRPFVGPKTIPAIPALLLADTAVHPAYRQDVQTARRTILVDLEAGAVGQRDWVESSEGGVEGWRKRRPGITDWAADVFLSDAMERLKATDKYGALICSTFADAARTLGFKRLCDPTEDFEPNADLKELYALWVAAPKSEGDTVFKGGPWVFVNEDFDGQTPIHKLLTTMLGRPPWNDLQVLTGAQWGQIIKDKPGLRIRPHRRGQRFGIRFMDGPDGRGGRRAKDAKDADG
jgi:hypothetical protein